MKILFAGGGTWGHLFPIIAVARELQRLHTQDDLELFYLGPKDENAKLILKQEGIKASYILAGKLRRYFSFQNILDALFNIPISFLQSFYLLLINRPHIIFSKGGTGSLPVTFAARLLIIPVFLHESDIVPGLSNRITSKWAKKVFVSFEKTEYFDLSKVIVTGTPIKKELLEGEKASAKELFNLTSEKPVLLFLGGSQGAESINNFVMILLADLLKEYEVIHVCGKRNYNQLVVALPAFLEKEWEPYYHLYASLTEIELKHAYAATDLIISRAGSASIFEIAGAGKPCVLIPLPSSAGDHQSKNAYEYAKNGAAIIIEQENLIPNFFIGKINYIVSSPTVKEEMRQAALNFAKPLAAKQIAREILQYLQK